MILQVDYKPSMPDRYNPAIAVIGCGGITKHHLQAYRNANFRVVALCDINLQAAQDRAAEFFPEANVYSDYQDVLLRDDVEVVDIATHPAERSAIIRASLLAKKHVLSQKPFVLDLDVGEDLIDLADRQGVKLGVNQNARWAPHFSFLRVAAAEGLIGDVFAVHMSVHWDHNWTAGTEFEKVRHLIMYDFAIHWFDMVQCLMKPQEPLRVFASVARTARQKLVPPLLGQAAIEYEHGQASLAFDADSTIGSQDRTYVAGTSGCMTSIGPDLQNQTVAVTCNAGGHIQTIEPNLEGKWFPDGFQGTMGELLCSIEQNRAPTIAARSNLRSLALCFAAVASADTHQPVVPGTVRRLII